MRRPVRVVAHSMRLRAGGMNAAPLTDYCIRISLMKHTWYKA